MDLSSLLLTSTYFHFGSSRRKSLGHLIMKGVLAACALTASSLAGAAAAPVMTLPVSDAQLAEVLVVGKQPGPGLWRISKGDHDLWIFATPLRVTM